MDPGDTGADKLAHAYSVTAHRSQGQTVDVTHALEDGGGRELAYVAMSRARGESHVHVVAPDIRHAARRLAWAWGQERRQHWANTQSPEERLVRLYHERQELRASLPPDRSADLDQARRQLRTVEQDTADLHAGIGRWTGTAPGEAARNLRQAALGYQRATEDLEAEGLGPWGRHKARRQQREATVRFDQAKQGWEQLGQPYADQLETARGQLTGQAAEFRQAQQAREAFLAKHPDVPHRLAELGRAIEHEQEVQRGRSTGAYCNESRLATYAFGARRTPAGGSKCDAQRAVLRVGSTPARRGRPQSIDSWARLPRWMPHQSTSDHAGRARRGGDKSTKAICGRRLLGGDEGRYDRLVRGPCQWAKAAPLPALLPT